MYWIAFICILIVYLDICLLWGCPDRNSKVSFLDLFFNGTYELWESILWFFHPHRIQESHISKIPLITTSMWLLISYPVSFWFSCILFVHNDLSFANLASMDPMELMRQMREDGYGLKENVLGHHLNPTAANQVHTRIFPILPAFQNKPLVFH